MSWRGFYVARASAIGKIMYQKLWGCFCIEKRLIIGATSGLVRQRFIGSINVVFRGPLLADIHRID